MGDGAVKHTDGTRLSAGRSRAGPLDHRDEGATVFKILADNSKKILEPLYGSLRGILVSDRAKALGFWAMDRRQICWAHLLRNGRRSPRSRPATTRACPRQGEQGSDLPAVARDIQGSGSPRRRRRCAIGTGVSERARESTHARRCKRLGIHPRAYLRDTLAKILAGEKDLTALLPETYAASLAERAPAVAA